tara:strand:+ start:371 stop:1294 length:924 start_codon:yes stop_codon:yes gene_type:complete
MINSRSGNPYFPQLVPEYTPQGLLDWSEYMPEGGMFGHEQYQPWTNPNSILGTIVGSSGSGGSSSSGGYTGGYTPPSGLIEVASSPSAIGTIDDPWSDYPAQDRHLPRPDGGVADSVGPGDVGAGGYGAGGGWPGRPEDRIHGAFQDPTKVPVEEIVINRNIPPPPEKFYPNQIGITPPPTVAEINRANEFVSAQNAANAAAAAAQQRANEFASAQAAAQAAAAEADRERQLAHNLARIASRYGSSDHQQDMAEEAMGKAMADYARDFPQGSGGDKGGKYGGKAADSGPGPTGGKVGGVGSHGLGYR